MKNVIIYTQPTCPPCFAEKEWLKAQQITFEERDIRSNPTYMNEVMALGASQTPVTVVADGDQQHIILGFDEDQLTAALCDS
ncbi:hypothetical protein A374_03629 [Fictibacillus macauensis ZFHKF-1]|uniref:Glutaredoxin domain-containing protein n=1 Tax=Fictibacillus macauensis ZFHKF-1 TaxID=1196324 RepID=I8UIB2_9BACL|nr:glutaredoxin family protein [Fictibacillus macauensis]EIT86630.1 hypothetical protein A374_03629 [Fictibacillus macauensis ZFHKF-1]